MNLNFLVLVTFLIGSFSFGYEGPKPLIDIKIDTNISLGKSGIYKYSYKITNPSSNNGEIMYFAIFFDQNSAADTVLSDKDLAQCPMFSKTSSANANRKYFMPQVWSEAPTRWTCNYGTLPDYSKGSFGWGAREKDFIKPGKSQDGFSLLSYGIPAILDVLVKPYINLDLLSNEYEENLEKTVALRNKVKWMGKTIGPKAPPKVFNAKTSIQSLIDLESQSLTLEWIKDSGISKSFEAKLESAAKKIESGDKKAAKNILKAYLSEVETQQGKHLTTEAYAVLYYNGKYILDHLD